MQNAPIQELFVALSIRLSLPAISARTRDHLGGIFDQRFAAVARGALIQIGRYRGRREIARTTSRLCGSPVNGR
jgi:hypothetical protein